MEVQELAVYKRDAFQLIYNTTRQEETELPVTRLIELCNVSKSGYYNWVNVTRVNQKRKKSKIEETLSLFYQLLPKMDTLKDIVLFI